MLPIDLIRVLDVSLMAGGWLRFKVTVESDTASTRRRPTYTYNGRDLQLQDYEALKKKAKDAGLVTGHPSFYDPERATERAANTRKQTAKYVPQVVPSAVYQAARRKKLKLQKSTRGAPTGNGARVAKGNTHFEKLPGYALVAHAPLQIGTPVVAIDIGGDWYNGRIEQIVSNEATIHFDYYSSAENVTYACTSSNIRYRIPPPPAPVVATAASSVSQNKRRLVRFDLNYDEYGDDDDDEEDEEDEEVEAAPEEPEVITEPESSDDDVEDPESE